MSEETVFDHFSDYHKDHWVAWGLDKVRQGKETFQDLDDNEKLEVTKFILLEYGKEIVYLDDDVEWQYIYGTHFYENTFKHSVQRAVTRAAITVTEKIVEQCKLKMQALH